MTSPFQENPADARPDYAALAAARAQTGGNGAADCPDAAGWLSALEGNAALPPFARLSEKQLHTLACACAEPRQLALLLLAFARHAGNRNTGASEAATPAKADATGKPASEAHLPAKTGTANASTAQPASSCACSGNSSAAAAQPPYALLCDTVDASRHDLREWVNALSVFDDWLREHRQPEQPLAMLLGYLSCTAEAQANSPMPLTLPHILADMLDLYGYDGDTAANTEPE